MARENLRIRNWRENVTRSEALGSLNGRTLKKTSDCFFRFERRAVRHHGWRVHDASTGGKR